MKRTVIGFVLGLTLVAGAAAPLVASAATLQELQAQLASVLSQLNALKASESQNASSAQAIRMMPPPVYEHRVCKILSRNLTRGYRGDDVTALQEFLAEQGYFSGTATGYYGAVTAAAVARYQSAEGVSAVGVVGPMTREKIKLRCGGVGPITNTERFEVTPTSGYAPLTATFSTWISGFRVPSVTYLIDYGDGTTETPVSCNAPADACIAPGKNVHTYSTNGTYTAVLYKMTDPCYGNNFCRAAIMREAVAKQVVYVGSGTNACKPINYMPIACSDGSASQPVKNESGCTVGFECPTANYTPPATCKAWNDGCNECSRTSPDSVAACTKRACIWAGKGYCSVYFDAATGNKAPTISGFSGPTALTVNQSGTWTINASDPESGTLSYSITWGDEGSGYPTAAQTSAGGAYTQTSTFSHTYTTAGTYTVTMVVRDAAGLSAKTTTTVQVSGGNVVCTMEYAPVCARPAGCTNTCAPGQMCTAICQLPEPKTYSNRCQMNAAGASYMYEGACTTQNTTVCTADAMQCPNGQWVGRTGPSCQFVCN